MFSNSSDFYRDLKPLNTDLAICAYRLVQEALSNAIKHSHARRCTVDVCLIEETLRIVIRDNGVGFSAEKNSVGIGLIGMGERVHAFDGTLQIDSALDEGTSITITFPA